MSIHLNHYTESIAATSGKVETVGLSPTSLGHASGIYTCYGISNGAFGATYQTLGHNVDPNVAESVPSGRFTMEFNSIYCLNGKVVLSDGDYTNGASTARSPICVLLSDFMVRTGASGSAVLVTAPTKTKIGSVDTGLSVANVNVIVNGNNLEVQIQTSFSGPVVKATCTLWYTKVSGT